MDVVKIAVKVINLLGNKGYDKFRSIALEKNRTWLVNRCDLYRFYLGKTQKEISSYTEITRFTKGLYDYQYFNICFFNDVLSFILESIAEKKIPRIEIKNEKGENIWEWFFEQPYEKIDTSCMEEVVEKEERTVVFPQFHEIYSDYAVKIWGELYRSFFQLNKETEEYILNETKQIFQKTDNVLAVLCRGTDYTICKPKGHPVQPEIEDMLKEIKQVIAEKGYEYIYLATEDGEIDRTFRKEFPDKILINKRTYYDDIFRQSQLQWIKDVHFERENDEYLKGLEYLSSLYIVSQCKALIAGNCGGSQMAVFLNGGRYEYEHVFDLGMYGEE